MKNKSAFIVYAYWQKYNGTFKLLLESPLLQMDETRQLQYSTCFKY